MLALLQDTRIQKIINPPNSTPQWENDLRKLEEKDMTLDRRSAGENSICAFQRLLIFLGYSTSSSGSFAIDGDFGRGTNRGLAQFIFEHGLDNSNITRDTLTYDCNWRNASSLIRSIPEVRLNIQILEKMLEAAKNAIETKAVNCGDFDEAIFHLNALHDRDFLSCRRINERYGSSAEKASEIIGDSRNITIHPEWILAIIKQETSGVVRPRFEQHWLTKLSRQHPDIPLEELRYQSMSFGLGQIMGFNFDRIGANSAKELYTFPLEQQITSIARFLTLSRNVRNVVNKVNPTADDFRVVAKYYNGSGYATHHYDESLARWFREFKLIRS